MGKVRLTPYGQQFGIFGSTWAAVALGSRSYRTGWLSLSAMPSRASCRLRFTMKLFIAPPAFVNPTPRASAKLSFLSGSLISGIVGLSLVYMTTARTWPCLADSSNLPGSSL